MIAFVGIAGRAIIALGMRSRFHRRRKKKPRPEPVREVLIAALKGAGLTDQAQRLRIFCLWKEVVGEAVAARTSPHAFGRGILTIRVHSAAWQNELTYMKRDLIAKLNAAVGRGAVKDIKIISGVSSRPPAATSAEPLPPCSASERIQADHVASEIDDPDLRDQFAGLMKTFYRARRGTS